MIAKLFKFVYNLAKALAILILIAALTYLFGDFAYIAVPLICLAGLLGYLIYDINKRKIPFRIGPSWNIARMERQSRQASKLYHMDTRSRYSSGGRRMSMEARGRNRYR